MPVPVQITAVICVTVLIMWTVMWIALPLLDYKIKKDKQNK